MPRSEPDPEAKGGGPFAGGVLTIDLDAIAANWRSLAGRLGEGVRCAAVVKADAYGLGMAEVAPALAAAGCDIFFVAQLDEGLALRRILPGAEIAVLAAPVAGAEGEYRTGRLLPVLNSLADLDAWRRQAQGGEAPPAMLHVDTGMARLGLSGPEFDRLAAEPERLRGVPLAGVMSHLACADEPEHPLNAEQLAAFRAAIARLPVRAPASLANSSGIFLGADYHFDLARPGIALYGGNPVPGRPNPMRPVLRLQGRILQIREVDRPLSVGYGAAATVRPPARLATVSVGYADGYLRSLSGRGHAWAGGVRVPVIGRVSMDLVVFDITGVPAEAARAGAFVDLIGPGQSVDELAAEAGTISYEILTSLGSRYRRRYIGGASPAP